MTPPELMVPIAVAELPTRPGLIVQPKFDGWRASLTVGEDRNALVSRSGRRLDGYFPDLLRLVRGQLPVGTVLDGELVAWSVEHARTDFAALQRRLTAGRELVALAARFPASYVVFDLLVDAGTDVRRRPLRDRLDLLDGLLAGAGERLVRCPETSDLDQAKRWMTTMRPLGVEGLVLKPADGAYRAGRHRDGWVKWRFRHSTETIAGGLTGERARPDTLLLGRFDIDGRLRLVGHTTRLSTPIVAEIAPLLHPPGAGRQRPTHPWPNPLPVGWLGRWGGRSEPLAYRQVEPDVVIEVQVDTAFELGRFRHPCRVLRARLDMSPYDVPVYRRDEPE